MKKLKIGDIVEAVFLGSSYECQVIEIIEKHKYKLRKRDGTILPNVTWKKLLTKPSVKDSPWHLVKYIGHKELKVQEKVSIQTTDLDKAIAKQKRFLRGDIKE